LSPAIELTSEKLDIVENWFGKNIGVEVNTDPGSWAEILTAGNQNVFDRSRSSSDL
jgi:hypothetical protein